MVFNHNYLIYTKKKKRFGNKSGITIDKYSKTLINPELIPSTGPSVSSKVWSMSKIHVEIDILTL